MRTGAVYIRVSTDLQTEYSPEAQLRALREYAHKNQIILPDEYIFRDEGISGKKAEKRPAFQQMIAAAKKKPKPFDIILVHKFDRFARSREDSVVYKSLLRKECGIQVVSITEHLEDDKFSVIMESMLEAMAEYYSLNLADEVKKGLFEKARRGENIGRAPFGYKISGSTIEPKDFESDTVKLIFEMYMTNSISKIAQYLNANHIPGKYKGKWTQNTLKYILQNPVYCGTMRYNYRKKGLAKLQNPESEWILAESSHEPLVSEEMFYKAQRKLADSENLSGRSFGEKSVKSWLSHISKCSNCGAALTISTSGGGKYKMFRCSGYCGINNTYSAVKFESLVLNQIKQDFVNSDSIVIEKISDSSIDDEYSILNKRLVKVREKYNLARKSYLNQADTLDEYKSNKAAIIQEETALLLKIKGLESKKIPPSKIKLNDFLELLSSENFETDKKSKIAKAFIKEVRFNLKTKEFFIVYYI